MSEEELQKAVSDVLAALKTNSLTIQQLTLVKSLPEDCFFEISGGRKISSTFIKNLVSDYVEKETTSINISISDLYKKISEYNVSALYPRKGLNGGDKYTLSLAVSVLNEMLSDNYKREWVKIIFKTENNKEIGYIFQSGDFSDISNWKPLIVSEFGESEISAISQRLFTDKIQYVSAGKIDITKDYSILDKYYTPMHCGWYVLMVNKKPAYHLLVTSDNMSNVITQFLYGNSIVDANGVISGHVNGRTTVLIRTYNFNATNLPDVPLGTWSKWKYFQEEYLKSDFGDSETDAITQSFFTEQINDRGFIKTDITSEDELDSLLEPGAYKITITGKIPLFFLLFITKKGVGPSSITTQLKLSDVEIYTRILVKNYWSDWEYFQKSFLKSSYGNSETDTITQNFFTGQLDARGFIEVEITSDTGFDDLRGIGAYKVIIPGRVPTFCFLFVTIKGTGSINQVRLSEGNIYRRALINNTWSDWENETFRNKVMTKDEFEKLDKKNDDTFYFTYEDE